MSYYFSKVMELSFADAVVKVTDELKKEELGVFTTIDVKETLKES